MSTFYDKFWRLLKTKLRDKETMLQESNLIPEENTISLTKKKCRDCEVIGLQFDSLFNYSIIIKKTKKN